MEEKKDLLYLIEKIILTKEFWSVNYYLCSMKKAPHGGVIRVFHPNTYLRYYPFQPWTFVCHEPETIPYFMQEIVERSLTLLYECDRVELEELLQYCFNGDNWYLGFRLLHVKQEYKGLNEKMSGTLLWGILENHQRITDYFDIEARYAIYALILCLVGEKAIAIKNIQEIQEHERLREPHNKYGLSILDNVEFQRQGFRVEDTYYLYNLFVDPTIASPHDTMPLTFRIITDEIPEKRIFMRCDDNLAVPYLKKYSTATVDAQKFHGITVDLANIDKILHKQVVVHIHPTLAHKVVLVIKPDSEDGAVFYHLEVEELWEPDTIRDDIVFATFIHAKYFPKNKAFTHVDFSINQYNAETYIAKYKEAVDLTGIPIDKYGDIHYKIWCVEAKTIGIETWSKLVCATLDEPFRDIFLEMFCT